MLLAVAHRYTRHKTIWSAAVLSLVLLLVFIQQTATFEDLVIISFPSLNPLKPADPLHPETYDDSTTPIFPPTTSTPGHSLNLCANFPPRWLEKVQVVLKTGLAESERNRAHLASVTSCIENIIIVSDFEEQVGGYDFIDVLDTLPATYGKDPDLDFYFTQRSARLNNESIELSPGGWKLDRYKFLPMVETAYQQRPHADWYVFLEADVYMFWDNLFRLLDQYDPEEMHYLGSAVAGSRGRWFAYGGAGIVLSQGLMAKLVGHGPRLSERYQKLVSDDCCGDAVLAYAIYHKTGVKLESLHPMLSGDYLEDLEINEQRWCTPLVSLHRMTSDKLRSLWNWERTRRAPKRPLVYSDMLEFRQPFLQNTSYQDFWDNLSPDLFAQDHAASESLWKCAEACESNRTCLQFSYTSGECRSSSNITYGHRVTNQGVDFTSGWDRHKMREMGLDTTSMASDCKIAKWTRPMIHFWGDVRIAAAETALPPHETD